MIDLQQSNLCKDRGRFRVRIAHASVEIARVPANQDIADVEDDAIDLPHSWYPSLKLATESCARLNHSRSSIEGQLRTVRHRGKRAKTCRSLRR